MRHLIQCCSREWRVQVLLTITRTRLITATVYPGGLQVWDTRKRSCRQSDLKWGLTGAPQDIGKVGSLGNPPSVKSHAILQHACNCCLPACRLHANCTKSKGCMHPTPACKSVSLHWKLLAWPTHTALHTHTHTHTHTHARTHARTHATHARLHTAMLIVQQVIRL